MFHKFFFFWCFLIHRKITAFLIQVKKTHLPRIIQNEFELRSEFRKSLFLTHIFQVKLFEILILSSKPASPSSSHPNHTKRDKPYIIAMNLRTCVSSHGTRRTLLSTWTRDTFSSNRASLIPKQIRGPWPNGM